MHEIAEAERIISHIRLDGYELSNEGYNLMKRIVRNAGKLIKEYDYQRDKRKKERLKNSSVEE